MLPFRVGRRSHTEVLVQAELNDLHLRPRNLDDFVGPEGTEQEQGCVADSESHLLPGGEASVEPVDAVLRSVNCLDWIPCLVCAPARVPLPRSAQTARVERHRQQHRRLREVQSACSQGRPRRGRAYGIPARGRAGLPPRIGTRSKSHAPLDADLERTLPAYRRFGGSTRAAPPPTGAGRRVFVDPCTPVGRAMNGRPPPRTVGTRRMLPGPARTFPQGRRGA